MRLEDVAIQANRNHLLAALPPAELESLLLKLGPVKLELGQVLYESGDEITHVYFPTTAIVSMLYIMENGATAEIGIAGNNGLVGYAAFMGGVSTSSRAIVQVAGEAVRIPSRDAKAIFSEGACSKTCCCVTSNPSSRRSRKRPSATGSTRWSSSSAGGS